MSSASSEFEFVHHWEKEGYNMNYINLRQESISEYWMDGLPSFSNPLPSSGSGKGSEKHLLFVSVCPKVN